MKYSDMGFIEDHIAYTSRLESTLKSVTDLDLARKRLTYLRWKVAENLDKILFEFETNVKKTDAGVIWCPDAESTLEALNKHLKQFNKVRFLMHNSVRHMISELDLKEPEQAENPEVVVAGSKFIMANTGNLYLALNSHNEYEMLLKAKKIIVVGGVDNVLAQQSELQTAAMLYAVFETGSLSYPAGILTRPGRIRGLQSEIVFLLTDLNRSRLLEHPEHRPLFSLLNFDLPPVCPMHSLRYDAGDPYKNNTLTMLLNAFMHGMKENKSALNGNYGLAPLNAYLPYDLDLYDQVLTARSGLHAEDKSGLLSRIMDPGKAGLVLNPKKFVLAEKFRKYAAKNFFGKS